MYFLATDAVPSLGANTINTPVLTLLLALISLVTAVWVESIKARRRATEAKEVATQTLSNTNSTANGFASDVLTRLERIDRSVIRLEDGFQEHLSVHIRENLRKDVS
jgi:hypothetical protein